MVVIDNLKSESIFDTVTIERIEGLVGGKCKIVTQHNEQYVFERIDAWTSKLPVNSIASKMIGRHLRGIVIIVSPTELTS